MQQHPVHVGLRLDRKWHLDVQAGAHAKVTKQCDLAVPRKGEQGCQSTTSKCHPHLALLHRCQLVLVTSLVQLNNLQRIAAGVLAAAGQQHRPPSAAPQLLADFIVGPATAVRHPVKTERSTESRGGLRKRSGLASRRSAESGGRLETRVWALQGGLVIDKCDVSSRLITVPRRCTECTGQKYLGGVGWGLTSSSATAGRRDQGGVKKQRLIDEWVESMACVCWVCAWCGRHHWRIERSRRLDKAKVCLQEDTGDRLQVWTGCSEQNLGSTVVQLQNTGGSVGDETMERVEGKNIASQVCIKRSTWLRQHA